VLAKLLPLVLAIRKQSGGEVKGGVALLLHQLSRKGGPNTSENAALGVILHVQKQGGEEKHSKPLSQKKKKGGGEGD